ncbi:hypothetical protein C8R44DRAFT_869162 [Mycena epipterygia]|nr:hypothetical protein C8R44DRAFT_869162 [Mycena epipterygia]
MDTMWEVHLVAGEMVTKVQYAEQMVGLSEITENEDEATFPSLHTTCLLASAPRSVLQFHFHFQCHFDSGAFESDGGHA